MGLAAFLVVIQSLILLIHWIVFRSIEYYFGLNVEMSYWFGGILFFLAFSFLLTNISTRLIPSTLTRKVYHVAAIWLGTIHFLFLGATLVACLQFLSNFLSQPLPLVAVYSVYLVALALSGASLIRSYDVRVRHETIHLPNLLPQWQGKRVVFFADTHYGNIHREKAALRTIKLIEEQEPHLILMGGDFFDGPPIDPELVTGPYKNLTTRIPTYFVSGNHEEYGKKAEFLQSLDHNGFRIINDKKEIVDGLQIVGLDFMTTRTHASAQMTLEHLALDRSLPTIILKHVPRHMREIEAAGGHLMLSGHTHQGQVWPANLITRYIYRGFDYGLKTYKTLQVYTTSGAGSWGPPQRFGTQAEIVVFTLENK